MDVNKERCITKNDAAYPELLRQIRNAPKQLYVRGELPDEKMPAVAVIGARHCSSYGREMAQWFASEMAVAGVQIISGMARGIDGIAQQAALEAGGESFGILGCGTDICYPAENRELYEQLIARGGLITEYPMGTMPLPMHFPSRNRIISALADCVLVIEAKEKSGTLITVDFALEQGKDVFALPGRLTDALSCGCNRLLRQGAGLVLTPTELLEVLAGKGKRIGGSCVRSNAGAAVKADGINADKQGKMKAAQSLQTEKLRNALSPSEWVVYEQLEERAVSLQELYERIHTAESGEKLSLPEVMDILMELIMKDIILTERGNKYRRKK